jgi:hypothetical protein
VVGIAQIVEPAPSHNLPPPFLSAMSL